MLDNCIVCNVLSFNVHVAWVLLDKVCTCISMLVSFYSGVAHKFLLYLRINLRFFRLYRWKKQLHTLH